MAKGKKLYQYQVVDEQKQPFGHILYLLRHVTLNGAKSEHWVGTAKLRRFYQQNKLTGKLSDHVMSVVTAEPIKPKGYNHGKYVLTPRTTETGPIYSKVDVEHSPEKEKAWKEPLKSVVASKWQVPDEMKFGGKAKVIASGDRWTVVYANGKLDDDTYATEALAQDWADTVNLGDGN